jgi:hypothetical protein
MKVVTPKAKRRKTSSPVPHHERYPLRIAQLPTTGCYTVIDNGCDMAMLGQGWKVVKVHNERTPVIDPDGIERTLVDCIATILEVVGSRTRLFIARVNNAIYDPSRQESLLPPDQIRWKGNTEVNDKAIQFNGEQNIRVGDHTIDLLWDGKTFYFVHTSSKTPDKGLDVVDLTSRNLYDPTTFAQAATQMDASNVIDPDLDLVPTPEGGVELKCRRYYTFDATGHAWKPDQLATWQKRLAAANPEVVKKTFLATTQLVPSVKHENEQFPKDYHVTRFPMLSNRRLQETLYTDVVEHLEGNARVYNMMAYTSKSKIKAIYPMGRKATSNKALEALMSFCRDFGIPEEIKSDYANNLSKSKAWQRFARLMVLRISSSEAEKQNQNTVERAWQDIQRKGHWIEQQCAVPSVKKFSLYKHLCDVHNHTALHSLKWRTPLETIDGETPDISFLRYHFWEQVWYLEGNARFPERKWLKGRFEGVAWTTGDQMCYHIAPDSDDKQRRVVRSLVLPRHPDEKAPLDINKRPSDYYFPTPLRTPLAPIAGRKRTLNECDQSETSSESKGPSVETVLDDESDDPIPDSDNKPEERTEREVGREEQKLREEYLNVAEQDRERYMELTTPPPDILDHGDVVRIKRHRTSNRAGKKSHNFCVEMSMGKDLNAVALDDMKVDCPAMLARYITDNKSLSKVPELVAWARPILKSYDRIVKIAKQMERRFGITLITLRETPAIPTSRAARVKCRRRAMSVSTKSKLKSNSPNKRKSNSMGGYQYGVYVPRNTIDALETDKRNNNRLWRDSIIRELASIQQYGTFKVVPKKREAEILKSHQYAPLRCILCVKEDMTRKSRLIIGGHVVDSGDLDTYSSNMRGISARILMLIASANQMDVLVGDISSAYLNADSDLDVVVRLGKEFQLLDERYKVGSLATVERALYGLSTSARLWRAALADTIRQMGFEPSRDDADVWYRRTVYGFEYIGTHTDDLLVASKDPQAIMDDLQKKYKMGRVEEPRFHLGCDYRREPDGSWSYGTKTHSYEAISKVETILGKTLGLEGTPMGDKCKPELDESPLVSTEEHRIYQQLIGIAQWLVTIGRLDIAYALNSLSRFSSSPREEQLTHAIRIFKYLKKAPEKWVNLDPGEHVPGGDIESPFKNMKPSWQDYYHGAAEELDPNHPRTGKNTGFKSLDTTVYFDSNFAHDEVTRRSVTGTITFVGNTPVAWTSRRQGAIATSTYGAELCAAKIGTEEAISIRCILRSFGVPIKGKTKLLGDNLGSLISVTTPGSPCKKKACSIAYHYVRECNAAGIIDVYKVHTDFNLSDAFTKALAKIKFWGAFKTIFVRRQRNMKVHTKRQRERKLFRRVRPKGRTNVVSTGPQ